MTICHMIDEQLLSRKPPGAVLADPFLVPGVHVLLVICQVRVGGEGFVAVMALD